MHPHQAIRLFLLTFVGGLLIAAIVGIGYYTSTRPERPTSQLATNSKANTNTAAAVGSISIRGTITELGEGVFTIVTQGVSDTAVPKSVNVHYTDDSLRSLDTAQGPLPGSTSVPQPHTIASSDLRIGDVVEITVDAVTAESTDVDAVSVLQLL
jgi:hypothetical protein